MNNAGISGVEVDGDISLLQEYIEADMAYLVAGGQVCFHEFLLLVDLEC